MLYFDFPTNKEKEEIRADKWRRKSKFEKWVEIIFWGLETLTAVTFAVVNFVRGGSSGVACGFIMLAIAFLIFCKMPWA